MRRYVPLALFFALALPLAAQPITVGSSMPQGDLALTRADGGQTTLRSLMGENGLVVAFWSNVCPWTERYTERLVMLARDYTPTGINFVAVNANDSTRFPDENVATMRLTADRDGFRFPYVVDPGSALATALGARNTPQFYFFSADEVLRYEGALDSSPADASRAEDTYLSDAMDQSLAGQDVAVQRTNALGCTIKRAE
jgi:thiol-disulfide isomerase/thioredoxin